MMNDKLKLLVDKFNSSMKVLKVEKAQHDKPHDKLHDKIKKAESSNIGGGWESAYIKTVRTNDNLNVVGNKGDLNVVGKSKLK